MAKPDKPEGVQVHTVKFTYQDLVEGTDIGDVEPHITVQQERTFVNGPDDKENLRIALTKQRVFKSHLMDAWKAATLQLIDMGIELNS